MAAPAKEAGLLPCPFCGGAPAVASSEIPGQMAVRIRCGQCGCEKIGIDDRPWAHNSELIAAEKAIAAWNTRAPSPSPDQPAGDEAAAHIRALTARAEADEERLGSAIDEITHRILPPANAEIYIDAKWRAQMQVDLRDRILAALATEAKDGRAG